VSVMKHIRLLNPAVVFVLLLGLAVSCKSVPSESIKIAIMGPLSGNVKPFGEANRDGALLAIEEWNARGGVLGSPVEAVLEDCIFDSMQAIAEVTTEVIEEDEVHFIIGGIAHDAIIMSRIANPRKVLHISASSPDYLVTVDEEGRNKPYSFRAVPLDASMAKAVAVFAIEELGAHTAGVLYNEEDDIETHYAEWFRDGFQERGGIVSIFEPYDRTAYTHAHEYPWDSLSKVADADCDVLFLPGYSPVVNRIAEQAKEKSISATLLGSDAWDVSPQLDLKSLEGSYYWSRYSSTDPRDMVQDFIIAYEDKYGIEPDAYAALAYDAANILLQAIAEAGTADPGQVKDAVMGLKFEGITGGGTFDQFGNPVKEVAIVKIEGGRAVFHEFVTP